MAVAAPAAPALRAIPDRAARHAGILLGVGAMGALDEIAFHQLLQWHHFWVHGPLSVQIASDGVLHLFTLAMLVAGAARLWADRRRLAEAATARGWIAGILLGMGAFQLFDGTVNHKLLRLHEVRQGLDGPSLLPYDLAWNGVALLLLGIGWWLWRGQAQSR